MNLIELHEEEQRLLEQISEWDSEKDGQISEEEKQAIIDSYLLTFANFEQKVEHYLLLIKSLKARAEFRLEEAKALKVLGTKDIALSTLLEKRLIIVLQARNTKKMQTPRFRLTVAGNGGKKPLEYPELWANEPAQAPEAFHRTKIELDLIALREALERKEEIPGCKIGDAGFHLRIS